MVVRIRLANRREVHRVFEITRHIALAVAVLLTPVTVIMSALAIWRIAADMKWTGSFAIPDGLFSHWQVWLGAALALQVCARLLNRFGRWDGTATS